MIGDSGIRLGNRICTVIAHVRVVICLVFRLKSGIFLGKTLQSLEFELPYYLKLLFIKLNINNPIYLKSCDNIKIIIIK